MLGAFLGLLRRLLSKKVLGLLIIPVVIIALGFWKGRAIYSIAIKYLPTKQAKAVKIDKSDPNWLKKYCADEIKNLPQAPFKNQGLDGDVQFLGIPEVYLRETIPSDKWYPAKNCGLWYKYDPKEAYPSVAVEYKFDIRAANTFNENVDRLVSEAIDDSWRKISPIDDEAAGRPFYLYKGFPMVFTRERTDVGTVEFATFDWGANNFFVHLTVYEK